MRPVGRARRDPGFSNERPAPPGVHRGKQRPTAPALRACAARYIERTRTQPSQLSTIQTSKSSVSTFRTFRSGRPFLDPGRHVPSAVFSYVFMDKYHSHANTTLARTTASFSESVQCSLLLESSGVTLSVPVSSDMACSVLLGSFGVHSGRD
jgi:hypothetical protein